MSKNKKILSMVASGQILKNLSGESLVDLYQSMQLTGAEYRVIEKEVLERLAGKEDDYPYPLSPIPGAAK